MFGYVYDPIGNLVFGAAVTLTDLNTGTVWTTTTDPVFGYYSMDLNLYYPTVGWAVGDQILVEVTQGAMSGSNQGVTTTGAFIQLDVTLVGPAPGHDVTLTVTDVFGQEDSIMIHVPI